MLLLLNKKGDFNPKNIPDLFAWYDSSSPSGVEMDEADVVTWYDKSGNGKNLTSETARAIQYSTDGLVFDGTNSYMQASTASDWTFLHDGTGCSFFAVFETTDSNPANTMALFGTSNTSNLGSIFALEDSAVNDGFRVFSFNGTSIVFNIFNADVITQQATQIISCLFGIEDGATNDIKIWNGTNNFRNADIVNAISTDSPANPVYVGATATANAWKFKGKIKELIFYKRKLTSAERAAVYDYLNDRW